jgi:hypothetical protein
MNRDLVRDVSLTLPAPYQDDVVAPLSSFHPLVELIVYVEFCPCSSLCCSSPENALYSALSVWYRNAATDSGLGGYRNRVELPTVVYLLG